MGSFIYFTPATDVAAVNAKAEENGHGPDSLSIQLVNTVTGDPWFGAHSFVNLLEEAPTRWPASEFTVLVEIYEDGDPLANWQDALAKNNLIQPEA